MNPEKGDSGGKKSAATGVLMILASSQFLMVLDTSVMNVSIAQVAADLGTTVTGIQTAITLFTLVMASMMITGGKIGARIGRRRAYSIGCVIYGCGSFTTAISPNLTVLLFGWSLLEGLGAALIMPAIVALVAGNFPPEKRTSAYGTIAAAGAIAVAAGPLIGGAVTTFFTWRLVFAGEVVIVAIILSMLRILKDEPATEQPRFDFAGVLLSATGLALVVYGVLRSSEWGWVKPKSTGAEFYGLSPVFWLVTAGLVVIFAFFRWESYLIKRGREPLIRPLMLRNRQLTGGLAMFFFQFLVQAGAFFTIPLFLSVVLQLSSLQTGARLLPLSLALLVTAAGIPRFAKRMSPRLIVQAGLIAFAIGTVVLISAIDITAGPEIVAVPLLFMGAGIGAMSSQLGAVTVSAVDESESAEVGGLQNTVTNLGASLGTALVGSVLIATLSATLLQGIAMNEQIPTEAKVQAENSVQSVPFVSDDQARQMLLDAGVTPETTEAVIAENSTARLAALQTALAAVVIFAIVALFFSPRLPRTPPGLKAAGESRPTPEPAAA